MFAFPPLMPASAADEQDAAPSKLHSEADFPNVYLNDSVEASDMLDRARKLAERNRWPAAVELMDEIFERYGGALSQDGPGSYESMSRRVRQELCRWPPEATAAYRRRFDGAARRALQEAAREHDLAALLVGLERYFNSSVGLDMGDAAGQLAIEVGDFSLARRIYTLLLAEHPDAYTCVDELQGKLAIVSSLAGDWSAVEAYFGGRTGAASVPVLPWLGERRSVDAIIEDVRSYGTNVEALPQAVTWPSLGGSPRRSAVAAISLAAVAPLWVFTDFRDANGPANPPAAESFGRQLGGEERLPEINAVYADGLVVFQDAVRVWAIHADSGKLAWTYGSLPAGTTVPETGDGAFTGWNAPTLFRGCAYARLSNILTPSDGSDVPEEQSALVCLDAATGRLLWRTDSSAGSVPFAHIDYDGAVVALPSGRVYAMERRRRAFGFEDGLLVSVDAESGRLCWRTHLGSASTGGFTYHRPTASILAADSDTIYAATNLGTIAAVSAYTGLVRWLRMYQRAQEPSEWELEAHKRVPWRGSPVIIDGNRLICMPTDAEHVLILDSGSGHILQEIAAEQICRAECLLGVADGCLYGVGSEAFAYDIAAGRLVWASALPADDRLFGRGFLAEGSLFVPCERSLCVFDCSDGSRTVHGWGQGGAGGNLLPAGESLVVVGTRQVSALTDRHKLWNRLRGRMAAEPSAPEPALDFAESAFRCGDINEASAALTAAIDRAGGIATVADQQLKRRIFEDCLSFAESLHGEDSTDPANLERRLRLYRFASQCPPDKQAHIRYRLPFAEVQERSGRPDQAVDLLQQILADDSLRSERLEGLDPDRPIGEYCRQQIARLIEASGSQVYAEYERRAAALVEAGRAAGDVALLDHVLAVYPNATASRSAHAYRGRILCDQGHALAAARSFYHAYAAYPEATPPRADLLADIVMCYQVLDLPQLAARWLERAAREFPAASLTVNGRRSTWAALRVSAGLADLPADMSVPKLTLPLDQVFERRFPEAIALLPPPAQPTPRTCWRYYWVYTEGGLTAFDASTGEPVWEQPAPCAVEPAMLDVTSRRVIFATQHEVFACDSANGHRLWQFGGRPDALDSEDADHEDFPRYRYHAVQGSRLVAFRDDRHALCLSCDDGGTIWERDLEVVATGPVAFNLELIAYSASRSGSAVCCILDAATGRVRHIVDPKSNESIRRTFVSPDGRVIVLTGRALHCFDADSGELVWRTEGARQIVADSVFVDVDGVYFSDCGRQVAKISHADGSPFWTSESDLLGERHTQRLTVHGSRVVVSAEDMVWVLDALDGSTIMASTPQRGATLAGCFVTDRYLLALDAQPDAGQVSLVARAFSHDTSAAAQPDADWVSRGPFPNLRLVIVCDDALVVQDGRRIVGWTTNATGRSPESK